jgi:hypothetical protein
MLGENKEAPQPSETTRVVDGKEYKVRILRGTDGNVGIGKVKQAEGTGIAKQRK